MIILQIIGLFFAIEGIANVIYFRFKHQDAAANALFQSGRVLRAVLGIAVIYFGSIV